MIAYIINGLILPIITMLGASMAYNWVCDVYKATKKNGQLPDDLLKPYRKIEKN